MNSCYVTAAKGNPLVASWLAESLRRSPGVACARCSPATGRVRVEWRNRARDPNVDLANRVESAMRSFSVERAYALQKSRRMAPASGGGGRWHSLNLRQLADRLETRLGEGLTIDEVGHRLIRAGANWIPPVAARSRTRILVSQFDNAASALLASSLAASALTGGFLEAATILAVLGINGLIGYATESQAESALEALARLDVNESIVWRGGRIMVVSSEDLVPGDVIVLIQGRTVPADARLISAKNLSVDESLLTGESAPVVKAAGPALAVGTPLVERTNMVYMGTIIVTGEGRALVTSTGLETEAGGIQNSLGQRERATTHLQDQMNRMNRHLAELSLASSGLLLLLGWLRRQSPLEMFRTCVSMAVAAVPEGLPTVTTWSLSRAVSRLAGHNVLIRDLRAIETLGSLQVLCLDKTGTLTENKMKVVALAVPWKKQPLASSFKSRHLRSLMSCAALCNDDGSPTELALRDVVAAHGLDIEEIREHFVRKAVQHRDARRRYMVTWHRSKKRKLKMIKGSPGDVLALCSHACLPRGIRRITPELRARLERQNSSLSARSLRVLAFAYSESDGRDCIWLGLMGLHDAPRANMKSVLAKFHRAGIRTVMITGDQSETARAIALDLGLSNGERLVTVDMREGFRSDDDLARIAKRAHVFARVVPEDKQRIVRVLRSQGLSVGMVGDGINDALALKTADVGIAIGAGGSSVAREVASVTLLDDQISHLVEAISLGRATGEALRKAVRYLVTTNLAEMTVVLGETAVKLPEAMDPLQLLWLNLVTDTFPALAMAMDRPSAGLLKRGPQSLGRSLLSKDEARDVVREASKLVLPVTLGLLYGHARGLSKTENQTIVLNIILLSQALEAMQENPSQPIRWREMWKRHRPIAVTSLGTLGAHFGLTSLPGVRRLFRVTALKPVDLAVTSLIPLAVQLWGTDARRTLAPQ